MEETRVQAEDPSYASEAGKPLGDLTTISLTDSATTESPIMDIRTIASNVHPPPEGFWSSDQCCVLRHIQSGSKPNVTNDVTAAHTDHATVRS